MVHPSSELMSRVINLAREKYQEGGHAVAALIVKSDEIIAYSGLGCQDSF